MPKSFQVGIYSSDRVFYEGQAVSLVVPCEAGYLGILAKHAPLAAKICPGKIAWRSPKGAISTIDYSDYGFLEISDNQATLLL